MDEFEAIRKLKHGDLRGLEVLVRKYQLEAVKVAFPITNDLGLAEEIVQEAFLTVYQRIHQYDERRPFRAWFLRIVVNNALKAVKKQDRLISIETDDIDGEKEDEKFIAETADERLTFEQFEFSDAYADAETIKATLKQLSPEHRTVLVLKYYLDLTDDEIADIVRVSSGTVKSRLHAAKAQVRSLLKRLNFLFLS
jgi:RNA polymerase sigma-70 factor (ECF subfamily)